MGNARARGNYEDRKQQALAAGHVKAPTRPFIIHSAPDIFAVIRRLTPTSPGAARVEAIQRANRRNSSEK